ncbi:MAG: hypothetical protein EFT35_01515 [Methanophagales archaeon ANME-1-THS]|nr:MAG: hypothetical protein EFT35_01515 [Methanophagales archaeon ANME-1-THS]
MLVIGAIQFTASAALPSARSEAKDRMTGAILGLLLLFATYVILNTINPELVMPGLGLSGKYGTISGLNNPSIVLEGGVYLYTDEVCKENEHRYVLPAEKLKDTDMNDNSTSETMEFRIPDPPLTVVTNLRLKPGETLR